MEKTPRLAITLGDPCGIGPELFLKLLPKIAGKWRVTAYGSPECLSLIDAGKTEFQFHKDTLLVGASEAAWIDPLPGASLRDLRIGSPGPLSGKCAVEAVRRAALDAMSGKADALLTMPISKAAAHMAGYCIQGHTELLQMITGSPRVQMAFVSPSLKVVLHTAHQSLRSAVEELNAKAVADTLIFAAQRLAPLLNNRRLKIALCALNPHAGESRAFGNEESILEESIRIAQAFFVNSGPAESVADLQPSFHGPCPADTVFLQASQTIFDVVVALYHDQGLIPIKLIEPESAVNLTLGLPFIRVSPGHGVAYDIAGKWLASPNNSLAASQLALSLLR
jgi:4-hydroxythreonine-4-phosphate dehydrogenase